MSDKRYTALILAATRGNRDPLAEKGGVSHKAFILLHGVPMLRRVVASVTESGRVSRVLIAIEDWAVEQAKDVLAGVSGEETITFVPSRESIGASVAAIGDDYPEALPLIVTTGDNGLHTPEIVKSFCDQLDAARGDAALGLTNAKYVMEKYPEGARAFHRFKDGEYSSCNLYAVLTEQGLEGARVFNSGGQFGKKPRRLIGAFGLLAFIVYKSRLTRIERFLGFLSRALGLKVVPIHLPFAEGPIDIDRVSDWDLAEKILAERETA